MVRITKDYHENMGRGFERDDADYMYTAELLGLSRFMKSEIGVAIFGQFEKVGRTVIYTVYVGNHNDIEAGCADSSNSEMWDDIRMLKENRIREWI